MNTRKPAAVLFPLALSLVACGAPAAAPTPSATGTPPPAATETPASTPTATASPEPSLTPTPVLLDLEIVEWYEHAIHNLVDPSSTVTNVEVLIHNPNDFPVSIDWDNAELRFVNSAGEVVYTNPNPFFYIWEGEWMTPNQTAALQACMCFQSQGLERPEWESLELIAPLEITNPAYTLDVEVTAEFVLLEEVLHGYSGPAVATTLTNTSGQVLKSISTLVFARDASGRYVGMATFGNAVVSFTEDIGIQPGDTASGFEVSQIDYLGNERLTYEVAAIGIPAQGSAGTEEIVLPTGTPLAEWEGIPIMPGAISGESADGAYQYTVRASIDEVILFYQTELADIGYETALEESAEYSMVSFGKGDTNGVIVIAPLGGITGVAITMGG